MRNAIKRVLFLCFFALYAFPLQANEMFVRQQGNPGIIVLVHGLTGTAKETWLNRSGTYWPQLVQDDGLFAGMDIAVGDYPSSFLKQGFSIDGIADQLGRVLNDPDQKIGCNLSDFERVGFAAHSLGVIARKHLLSNQDLSPKVKGPVSRVN